MAHLEETFAAARERGLAESDATRLAAAELDGLGALPRLPATARTRHTAPRARWTALRSDMTHAVRLLRHRPAFASLAIGTLALGIAVCAVVFGIYNAVFARSLPFPDADRLVLVWEADPQRDQTWIAAGPVYEDWQKASRTLQLAAWEFQSFNVSADAEPELVPGIRASAELFDVLQVAPALGRAFTRDEDRSAANVVVISDPVWRAHFGGAADVTSRTLSLGGIAYQVVGVMPPAFEFPRRGSGIIVPMSFTAQDRNRSLHSFHVAGRLVPGASFEDARAELALIGEAHAAAYTEQQRESATATRMADFGTGTIRQVLVALSAAVALVLLIACVNVANLQMGLGLARRREFAVRMALGAGRRRLAVQLLMEALILAGAAGLLGLTLAVLGMRIVNLAFGADFLTFWFRGRLDITLDPIVIAFAFGLSLLTTLVFGLAPLIGARDVQGSGAIRSEGRSVAGGGSRLRRGLIAVEVALAVLVLCGAGLLLKSLSTLLQVDAGLDPERVVVASVSLAQPDPYGPAVRGTFCQDLAAAAAQHPLFASVSGTSHLPLTGANAGRRLTAEGRPAPAPGVATASNYRVICPGYFRTLGINVLAGREFGNRDRELGGVAIINRPAAEYYWPGESSIVGRRIKIGSFSSTAPWLTVVGIADDVRHFGLDSEPVREVYVPYGQAAWPTMTLTAKTVGPVTVDAHRSLREIVRRVDPSLPLGTSRDMVGVLGGSVAWRTSFLRLVGAFAVIALLLTAVGVYAIVAGFVEQQTRQIGIRVALGASSWSVAVLVFRHAAIPIVTGAAVGVVGSWWAGRLLVDALYQVQPGDVTVTTAVVGLILLVGLGAIWRPARRAVIVDPLVALRAE